MSLITDSMEYSPLLTWKLPPKKCIELKPMEILTPLHLTSPNQMNNSSQNMMNNTCHMNNSNGISNVHIINTSQINQTSQINHLNQINHNIQMNHTNQINLANQINHSNQLNMTQMSHTMKQDGDQKPTINRVSEPYEAKPSTKKMKVKSQLPSTAKKRFYKRGPIDGMAFHSQQMGLKVPPKKTLGIKGMIIHSQAREVINNVYKFMKEEAQNGTRIPLANYRERVLAATGISKCTYSKITTKEFVHGEPQPSRRRKKNIKIDTTMDASINKNDSTCLPKINRNASTRDGVYNLEDLVPEYILDTLAPEAAKIMYNIHSEQFGLTPFSIANISNIAKSTASEEVKIRRISIFMYIHYLIKFMNTPMKSVTKRFVVCDTSIDVNNHILETFCVKSQHGRTRPLHMKDKSLCFILVLAAIAMDYEVDVELLSKDMKIGVKKALEVSRILAFNATAHNKNVVTLKLPLPAPTTSNAKRKLR